MKARLLRLAVCTLMFGGAASAQVYGGASGSQNRQELRQGQHQAWDDYFDSRRLEALLARMDQARHRRDRRTLAWVDAELAHIIETEKRESAREVRQAHAEVRRDVREARSERREVTVNAAAANYHAANDSARDLQDARRDLRDDARDLQRERLHWDRVRSISGQLQRLMGRHDPVSFHQKRALVAELLQLSYAERRSNEHERREDVRELREDRRERREDQYRRN